jgi:hypothetical protein
MTYPRQGLVVNKPAPYMNGPFRQPPAQHFGSAYLPGGAGRAEELRGSLPAERTSINWIRARGAG